MSPTTSTEIGVTVSEVTIGIVTLPAPKVKPIFLA